MNSIGDKSNVHAAAIDELTELLHIMEYDVQVEAEDDEDYVILKISTEDSGRLIGRGARTLDALQYILNRILRFKDRSFRRCILDIDHYRERKNKSLLSTALDAADQARKTGDIIVLPAMNSSDRRTVHQALKEEHDITTNSQEADSHGLKSIEVICVNESIETEPQEEQVKVYNSEEEVQILN